MPAKKIVVNTFFLSVARFVGMLFSFLVILLISRVLGSAAMGQYNLAFSIAAFFIIFSDVGFSTIIVRELSKPNCDKDFFSHAFSTKLLFTILSVLLCLPVVYFFVQSAEAFSFFFLVVFSVIIDSFSLVFRSVFKAFQEMHLEAIVFVSQKIAFALLSGLLFVYGLGLLGIGIAFAASNVFSLALSLWLFLRLEKKPFFRFSLKPETIYLSSIIIPFILIGFLDMASSRLDIFLVKFFLQSDATLGLYSAPKVIFDALLVVLLSFFTALFPQFSFLFYTDKKKLSQLFLSVLKYLFVFSAPIVAVSIVFARQLVELFFGASFAGASNVFAIYSLSFALMLFQSLFFNVLFIANRQRQVGIIFALTIASNALLSFFLIPWFGINGAAFANLFSLLVCISLSIFSAGKIVKFELSFMPKFLLAFLFSVFTLFFLSLFGVFSLVLAIVFAPLFFFFACLDENERFFLLNAVDFFGLLKKWQ